MFASVVFAYNWEYYAIEGPLAPWAPPPVQQGREPGAARAHTCAHTHAAPPPPPPTPHPPTHTHAQRAKEQAESAGVSLQSVVAERWGSLGELSNSLTTGTAANSAWHALSEYMM